MRTLIAALLGVLGGALAHRAWVRLGQTEAELRAAEHDLNHRD